jgi:N-acetylmuramoyl-L-alanine amidase
MKVTSLIATIILGSAMFAQAETLTPKQFPVNVTYVEQLQCMALNIYHEARSDSKLGQEAVGMTTMNRVYHSGYPSTVCDVVYQAYLDSDGHPVINRCQFSWFCDGRSDTPRDIVRYQRAINTAAFVLQTNSDSRDITDGAIMYHAAYVDPYWTDAYERTVRIDSHIFYK